MVGIEDERRRDQRDDQADAERGDGVADAPADPRPIAGAGRERRRGWRRRRGRRRRRRRREGAAHSGVTLLEPARSVDSVAASRPPATPPLHRRGIGCTPGRCTLEPAVASADRLPAPSDAPRGRSMERPRRGAGPRMSRRQTDLEPGVEPDTGEPESFGAPNGRPPTPPPAWRPGTRPPSGPPSAGPHRRRSPRRTAADRTPAPHRWRQLAVAALGAVDRARAHRRRVRRQQPRRRQLVEDRPHLLAVRQPGRGRQRQEHRLQQVDRRDQRRPRDAGQGQHRVLELGARRTTCPTRCSRPSTRRTSTSTTSTRAATSSATSCCGCCRSS